MAMYPEQTGKSLRSKLKIRPSPSGGLEDLPGPINPRVTTVVFAELPVRLT
jgi:hypothetical protein